MITQSDNITNLAAALLKAQKAIGVAVKGSENPFYKSKYSDLGSVISAIKEPLNANGIAFLQAVDSIDGTNPVIDTILLHESGQFLSSRTPVFCAKTNDPQAFGSGVTYSKRYALQALLGLPTVDDDGEAATLRKQGKKVPTMNEVLKDAHNLYGTDQGTDVPEGFLCNFDKFKDALRREVKKKLKTQAERKAFAWTLENLKPFIEKIELADTLVEIERNPSG